MNLPACVVSYANELTIAANLGGNDGFETPLPLPAPHHQKSGYKPYRVFKLQLSKPSHYSFSSELFHLSIF